MIHRARITPIASLSLFFRVFEKWNSSAFLYAPFTKDSTTIVEKNATSVIARLTVFHLQNRAPEDSSRKDKKKLKKYCNTIKRFTSLRRTVAEFGCGEIASLSNVYYQTLLY